MDALKIKSLCGVSVTAKVPVSGETSEGVIYGVSSEIDKETLMEALKPQGVKLLFRMKSKKYECSGKYNSKTGFLHKANSRDG